MIRINLLPYRAARTKENVRQQVSIFLLSLLLISVILIYYDRLLNHDIINLTAEVEQIKKDIVLYQNEAKKVDEIKKKLEIIKQKTEIINKLEESRKEPVYILDVITQLIIPDRMWLNTLEVKDNNTIYIKGIAFDNKTIADFMVLLEKSTFFNNVNLASSRQEQFQGEINFKSFEINCNKLSFKKSDKPVENQLKK